MDIVFIVVGLVVGCIIGFLLAKSKGGADTTKLALLEQENERVKGEATELNSKISKLSSDYNVMMSERDVMKANVRNLEGQLANEKQATEKKVQELNGLMDKQSADASAQLKSQKEHSDKVLSDTRDQYESHLTSQSEQYDKQITDLKSRYDNQLESTKKHYESQLEELRTKATSDLEAYKLVAEKQRKELAETNSKATSETIRQYETQIANLKAQYAKQLEDLKTQQTEQAEQQMNLIKEQMNTASEKILKERSEQLSERNKEQLASILNPLKDGITQMKDAVEKSGQEHKETMVRLDATIKHSIEQSREVGERADKLAQALTGENKTQGNFGELRLKQLLEDMGLEEGTQFEEQTTMRDSSGRAIYDEEDGHRMIPDVILHFPDERDVIIDSKMSFKAFEDYHNAENDVDRQDALKRHIASVRQHVNELSRKNYSAYIKEGRGKLDFVLMYVFSESALQLALMNDTTLWKEAYNKGVIITGSQNLYMLLRVLEMTWRQVRQIENQEKMMKTANLVVDRVQMFYERFMKVDEMLSKTQKAFEEVKSVSGSSGQSIEIAAKNLIKFGAKPNPKRKYQLKNVEDPLMLEDDTTSTESIETE